MMIKLIHKKKYFSKTASTSDNEFEKERTIHQKTKTKRCITKYYNSIDNTIIYSIYTYVIIYYHTYGKYSRIVSILCYTIFYLSCIRTY